MYAGVDKNAEAVEPLTDKEIAAIVSHKEENSEEEKENENDEVPSPPSLATTISALNVVRQYVLIRRDDNDKEMELLQMIEDKLLSGRFINLQQTQITQFFRPL